MCMNKMQIQSCLPIVYDKNMHMMLICQRQKSDCNVSIRSLPYYDVP